MHRMARNIVFGLLYVIWIHSFRAYANCPIAECSCLDASNSNERIIDCRDKGLIGVPQINATDEIFKEITFSSHDPTCRENSPPTCSNRIIHLSNNAFAGLKVRKIDLSTNYLSSVESGAFNGLESLLTELLLEGDDVNPVPFSSLTNLTYLITLELESFKQIGLDSDSLPQDFPNLETLVLHTLHMEYISQNAVVGKLRKLKRLEIVDNPNFINFPLSPVRLLTSLEHIRFVKNGLTTFQNAGEAFVNLNHLTDLDLSHNSIQILQPGCFKHIDTRLEYLSLPLNQLSGNALSTVANGNWPKLEQLILDSNPIGPNGFPNNLFKNMPNLANLNLQQIQLTHIKQNDFEGLTNLHFLHLTGNDISQIDEGTFRNTPNLKELYLDAVGKANNKLNFSVANAQGLENLTYLDLRGSHFEVNELFKAITVMAGMKILSLTDTGISKIPDLTFQYNTNLEKLDLDENSLATLTQAEVHGLGKTLKTLNLNGNSISLIDKCVLAELSNLQQLSLYNNPLHCDCKLQELNEWAKRKESNDQNFIYYFQGKCASPPNLKDQNLLQLDRSQLICTDNTPIQCETFTTSTTSTTTITTPQVTTPPLPNILQFTIDGRNENGAQLSWRVENTGILSGYFITKHILGAIGVKQNITIGRGYLQYFLFLEQTQTDYEICIKAITSTGTQTIPKCVISNGGMVSSMPTATLRPSANLSSGEIAAIGVSSGILIILIVVILIFLLRYKSKPKNKDMPPVHFTGVTRPAVGYDSKRFSKPKKSSQANGDIIISAVSSGKTGYQSSPDSRHSAGSYQYLNENQMINIQPHLNYSKGANGTSSPPGYNDLKQQQVQGYLKHPNGKNYAEANNRSNKSQYDRTPGQGHHKGMAPKHPHQYVNDPTKSPGSLYTNDVQNRPLPKPKTIHYENNNSSGFLNHGYDLDSPTNVYQEIPETHI